MADSLLTSNWSATSENPERSSLARGLGLRLAQEGKELTTRDRAQFRTIFRRYDEEREGAIAPNQLEPLLTEFFGKKPRGDELEFMWRSMRASTAKRLREPPMVESLRAMELYEKYKADIDMMFYLYDANVSGMLEPYEVRHLLQELKGAPMPKEDVEKIMSIVDVTGDGVLSRLEFTMMVSNWPARSSPGDEEDEEEAYDHPGLTPNDDETCTIL